MSLPCRYCLTLPMCIEQAKENGSPLNILFTFELEDKCSIIVEYIRCKKYYSERTEQQYKIIEFFQKKIEGNHE